MKDIKSIVHGQKAFFFTGQTKDLNFRKKKLQELKNLIKTHEKFLSDEIKQDLQKSPSLTFLTEFSFVYSEIDEAIKHLHDWARPVKVKTNVTNFPGKSFILSEPLGTTLIIGAWNYPYQLVLAPAIAAIAAGNTAILKPSELTPRSASALKKIINEHFDPGFLHVIDGGVDVTTELLTYGYGKICFTGSTAVGKIIAKAAAETLTPTLLELGGKSPCLILPDVDVQIAAKRIVWGKFLNAGQTCIAPDYLLVHSSLTKKFLDELVHQIKIILGENPLKHQGYVQIINQRHLERLEKLIPSHKVHFGGRAFKEKNYFEPTILKDVSWDDECMKEEIFGPILPVLTFDDLDEVIKKIQQGATPLSLYLFTQDQKTQEKILRELSFGGGCINDVVMHFTNSELPFGGVGPSGLGSYHGVHGFKAFSHQKSILKKGFWPDPSLKYNPYSKLKLKMMRLL